MDLMNRIEHAVVAGQNLDGNRILHQLCNRDYGMLILSTENVTRGHATQTALAEIDAVILSGAEVTLDNLKVHQARARKRKADVLDVMSRGDYDGAVSLAKKQKAVQEEVRGLQGEASRFAAALVRRLAKAHLNATSLQSAAPRP